MYFWYGGNIREGLGSMTIHCNAGAVKTNTVGDLAGYGTVWYHPNGIANILSVSRVINSGYRVVYDSSNELGFKLSKGGCTRAFKQSEHGLFYIDVAEKDGSVFIDTVTNNLTRYTSRECRRADIAHGLQQIIGRPSTRDFKNIVNRNLLPNCPITAAGIMVAEAIYGPDLGSLKGKMVRRKGGLVNAITTPVPHSLFTRNQDVMVAVDILAVNSIPFVVSFSRNIKFGTVEMVKSHKAADVLAAIQQICSIYTKRGFRVCTLLMTVNSNAYVPTSPTSRLL